MSHGPRHHRSYGPQKSAAAHSSVTAARHSSFDAPAEGECSISRNPRFGYYTARLTRGGRTFSGCGDTEGEAKERAQAVAAELTGGMVVWASDEACPNGLHHFEDCACEPCGACDSVHAGRCFFPSAAFEDRRADAR
jgi:hypothetical protein